MSDWKLRLLLMLLACWLCFMGVAASHVVELIRMPPPPGATVAPTVPVDW